MFTVEELFSNRNQKEALQHLKQKEESKGGDGIQLSELEEYWILNKDRIIESVMNMEYEPGVIKCTEIINNKGKRRVISNLAIVDRLICRLLSQKLRRYMEPIFLENSFAYQKEKGVIGAVQQACEYIKKGNLYVTEIDLKDFFEHIPHQKMLLILADYLQDERIINLIQKYLRCHIMVDGRVEIKNCGILQGNAISPILSNLYLHTLDKYMQEQGLNWIRFADNIYVYCRTEHVAVTIFNNLSAMLQDKYKLPINERKSGVYYALQRFVLGYEFYKSGDTVAVRKCKYKKYNQYLQWHESALEIINREYHIVQEGVLNKKDYTLIFENEKEKHELPIRMTDHITLYSNVTISSAALKLAGDNGVRLSFVDDYGNSIGEFIPDKHTHMGRVFLKQAEMYQSDERVKMALKFEKSHLHNMRANLRYYNKKNHRLENEIAQITELMEQLNKSQTVNEMMLLEARAKQIYYRSFNSFLRQEYFYFEKRTKRPPRDEINAMISFGNTLLYNHILQVIYKTSLDPKIGVVHAITTRCCSLHLDFADVFKPVIVDRVIFGMINLREIQKGVHFEKREDGAVLLNKEGRRLFVERFETKMMDRLTVKNRSFTYRQLIYEEVQAYQRYIESNEKYRPYKYY